ncbi:hypothetical protein [Halorhabdus rudnickae]|uniref:hypothetical protein n=1 Tax=Halorhabdus rudnickae TaxID=1775544 RepID=UPI0010847060|nr:hypothetical protein [Halorhabdus rudnickae]
MVEKSVLLVLAVVIAVPITTGCLGQDAQSPSDWSVSFSEPKTGIGFSDMYYGGSEGGQLIYGLPNVTEESNISEILVTRYTENNGEYNKHSATKGGIYENFSQIYLDAPLKSSKDQTYRYSIVAKNESGAVIDSINATVTRNE